MDVGENLDWIGYAIIDQSMRIMGGLRARQERRTCRSASSTRRTSPQAGTPPVHVAASAARTSRGYQKLWGLK